MPKNMFAMTFDDKMRAARAKGIKYEKVSTVYENTPEFEMLWEAYLTNEDPMYHIQTEPDGRTHTFYYIHLTPTNDVTNQTVNEGSEALAEAAG